MEIRYILIYNVVLQILNIHSNVLFIYSTCTDCLGPELPYKVRDASMLTTDDNKILLVGGVKPFGWNDYYEDNIGSMLELSDLMTEWKEIDIPKVHYLRKQHLTLMITDSQKDLFCGE